MAEDVPENHVVSEDVGMLTGVTELTQKVVHMVRPPLFFSLLRNKISFSDAFEGLPTTHPWLKSGFPLIR